MTREEAREVLGDVRAYLASRASLENEMLAGHTFTDICNAIKAVEQEHCKDAVSRQAVADKLLRLCNELEGIFANIRMQNQDESVCGLCEYDCPAPFECPGVDIENCFKLAYEIRHKWQSTKDLSPVTPQPKTGHWIIEVWNNKEHHTCSNCQHVVTYEPCYHYCPYCGANMVEPKESEK